MNKRTTLSLGSAFLSSFIASAHAEYALNIRPPATEIARQIYDLHMLIVWVCLGIFVVVFTAMFYSIYKHRKSVGHQAAQFHEHHLLEVVWTIIPVIILAAMAWPATKTIFAMKDTSAADMSIKVTGSQWKWEYDYLDKDVKFISNLSTTQDQINNKAEKGEHYLLEVDNPMVVPVGKKIRVVLTANDVIHSWSVPSFGVKQDAIPGFIKETWFRADKEGTYRGQCSELCGKAHGFMPIVVEAVSEEKYNTWIEAKKAEAAAGAAGADKEWTKEDLLAHGKTVYEKNCAVCHQANGAGLPPAFPALTGSKIALGAIFGADGKYLPDSHLDRLLNGKGVMPPWKAQLNDVDIAAVITYERQALGNAATVDPVVQPAQVKAAR
ncbi:MAG: cytochrome c oxidase subunit II [Methylophilaceae bacterium]